MALAMTYGFGSFLFFKIASEVFLYEGMNLMLSTLAALAVFACASWLSRESAALFGRYAAKALHMDMGRLHDAVALDLGKRAIPASLFVFVWAIVMSIGFDASFYEGLRYRGWDWGELLILFAITATPIAIYAALSFWLIVSNAKRQV